MPRVSGALAKDHRSSQAAPVTVDPPVLEPIRNGSVSPDVGTRPSQLSVSPMLMVVAAPPARALVRTIYSEVRRQVAEESSENEDRKVHLRNIMRKVAKGSSTVLKGLAASDIFAAAAQRAEERRRNELKATQAIEFAEECIRSGRLWEEDIVQDTFSSLFATLFSGHPTLVENMNTALQKGRSAVATLDEKLKRIGIMVETDEDEDELINAAESAQEVIESLRAMFKQCIQEKSQVDEQNLKPEVDFVITPELDSATEGVLCDRALESVFWVMATIVRVEPDEEIIQHNTKPKKPMKSMRSSVGRVVMAKKIGVFVGNARKAVQRGDSQQLAGRDFLKCESIATAKSSLADNSDEEERLIRVASKRTMPKLPNEERVVVSKAVTEELPAISEATEQAAGDDISPRRVLLERSDSSWGATVGGVPTPRGSDPGPLILESDSPSHATVKALSQATSFGAGSPRSSQSRFYRSGSVKVTEVPFPGSAAGQTEGRGEYTIKVDGFENLEGLAGPDLGLERRGAVLLVRSVEVGSFAGEWNRSHAGQQIRRGDWIIAVNGSCGSASRLLQELMQSLVAAAEPKGSPLKRPGPVVRLRRGVALPPLGRHQLVGWKIEPYLPDAGEAMGAGASHRGALTLLSMSEEWRCWEAARQKAASVAPEQRARAGPGVEGVMVEREQRWRIIKTLEPVALSAKMSGKSSPRPMVPSPCPPPLSTGSPPPSARRPCPPPLSPGRASPRPRGYFRMPIRDYSLQE
mmetsp:Transcript_64642/g.142571  ORF Transcript_64642/g.142571 Transcript_64642/m.142571 type:complete len:751 (+) Transcript_64642:156-2408(+)